MNPQKWAKRQERAQINAYTPRFESVPKIDYTPARASPGDFSFKIIEARKMVRRELVDEPNCVDYEGFLIEPHLTVIYHELCQNEVNEIKAIIADYKDCDHWGYSKDILRMARKELYRRCKMEFIEQHEITKSCELNDPVNLTLFDLQYPGVRPQT